MNAGPAVSNPGRHGTQSDIVKDVGASAERLDEKMPDFRSLNIWGTGAWNTGPPAGNRHWDRVFITMTGRRFSTLKMALACLGLVVLAACDSPEERLESHYEDGATLVENGDDVRAALEFRNALQINPDHVPSLYGLARIEERRANWQAVGSLLNKIVDLDPTHIEATVRLGRIALLAGQIDRALELSNAASELAPDNIDAITFKAAVLLNLEDTEGALAAANAALALDPDNADAVSVLAAERIASGATREAVALLDKQLAKTADNVALQLIKIRALAALEDLEGVEDVLVTLTDLYPETNAFRAALIRLYMNEERYDDAEGQVRAVADASPESLEANLDVIRFLNAVRGVDAAEEEAKKLIARADVNQTSYRQILARLYLDTRRTDEARAVLQEIIVSDAPIDERFGAKNQLAQFSRLEGKLDEARAIIDEILAEDDKNAAALTTRAAILLEERKFDDAILDLRTVLRDEPDSVRAHILLGSAHQANGSIELADDQYARGFEASDGAAAIGLPYAQFLAQRGASDRADQILTMVVQRDPENMDALRALAQIKINNQDWVGAQQVAERLRQLDDESSVVDRIAGLALQGQERFEQSIEAFERSQEAAPDATRPLASLVGAYVRAGQSDRAKQFLESVLETSPNNAFAQVLIAQVLVQEGDFDGAEQAFEKAIERDPSANLTYVSMAGFYASQSQPDKAQETIDRGLEANPDDNTLRLARAGFYEQTGDKESALEQYRLLYEASPNSAILANNYAATLIDARQDRESAEKALQVAQGLLTSTVPQFQDTVGWIYYRLGQYSDAVRYLENAAERLPELAVVRYHLGMAYRATQDFVSAIDEFETVVELSETQDFAEIEEVRQMLEELREKAAPRTGN